MGGLDYGFTATVLYTLFTGEDAVMVALMAAFTALVVIGKVTVVAPAGTTTLAGTCRLLLLLLSRMVTPPLVAGCSMVTVPVRPLPLAATAIEVVTEFTRSGRTVSVLVLRWPLRVAVTRFGVFTVTAPVAIGKLAEMLPSGMVTVAGMDATASFWLVRVTVRPPAGAANCRVTVPSLGCPAAT